MRSEPYIQNKTLTDLRTDLQKVQEGVALALIQNAYTDFAQFAIRLCLEEPGKVVQFHCKIDGESAEFEIQDEGVGFDPAGVPDPTAEENLEIPSGRGLMLMRAYMSEVEHLAPGNMIRMKYKNGPDPAQ